MMQLLSTGAIQTWLASPRELQSATGEELSPSFTCTVLRTARRKCHFGDATQSALLPSILDEAFMERDTASDETNF